MVLYRDLMACDELLDRIRGDRRRNSRRRIGIRGRRCMVVVYRLVLRRRDRMEKLGTVVGMVVGIEVI